MMKPFLIFSLYILCEWANIFFCFLNVILYFIFDIRIYLQPFYFFFPPNTSLYTCIYIHICVNIYICVVSSY